MTAQRILLVNDFSSAGGAEEVYQLSARILREQRFEVSTFDDSDVGHISIAKNKVWNIAACWALRNRIRALQPHVVWLHNFCGFFSLAVFPLLKRLKRELGFSTVMTLQYTHNMLI
jgi:hypothetical protein